MFNWRVTLWGWRGWLLASAYGLFVVVYGSVVTGGSLLAVIALGAHELGKELCPFLGVDNPFTVEALEALYAWWVGGSKGSTGE